MESPERPEKFCVIVFSGLILSEEIKMSTYAIGDIHGCAKSLRHLVEWVSLGAEDTLVTLGDYIDRGSNSRGVIKYLRDISEQLNLVALKGNHELIMEGAMHSNKILNWWKNVGGLETLKSYGAKNANLLPRSHRKFVYDSLPFYETDTHIFVHGGVNPDEKIEEHSVDDLCWLRVYTAEAHFSGKIVVCGHTPQRNGLPLNLGHTICIDTWACNKGWLTCLDVETGRYWQVKEKGKKGKIKRREGSLW